MSSNRTASDYEPPPFSQGIGELKANLKFPSFYYVEKFSSGGKHVIIEDAG